MDSPNDTGESQENLHPGDTTVVSNVSFEEITPESVLWRKFDGEPPIPGLLSNVVVVFRESFSSDSDDKSDSESDDLDREPKACVEVYKEEVSFGREILKYLLRNGMGEVHITSNYPKYLKGAADKLIKKKDELRVELKEVYEQEFETSEDTADVTVLLLLPGFGKLQQLKMFQYVQAAYQASRFGVVIVGHTSVTEHLMEPKWKDYISFLKHRVGWKDSLEIVCLNHRLINKHIFNAGTLKLQSPLGGCDRECGEMKCGHFCNLPCHPEDPLHISEDFRCRERCLNVCPYGHKCKQPCWKECGNCYFVVTIDRSCQHEVDDERQAFCFQQSMIQCQVLVTKRLKCGHLLDTMCSTEIDDYKCQHGLSIKLFCGHIYKFFCYQYQDLPNVACKVPLIKEFPCGHAIKLKCSDYLKGGEDLECEKLCETKLSCGHICERKCHLDDPNHENFVCRHPCQKLCKRGAHFCSRHKLHYCGEPCSPCEENFEFILSCGHALMIPCNGDDPNVDSYVCPEKCNKYYPFCGHKCEKMCAEDCGVCEAILEKPVAGCPRGHKFPTKCQEKLTLCLVTVLSEKMPECGHLVFVPCYKADGITDEELAMYCDHPCDATFDGEKECGHKCQGDCRNCFQGRFHVRCKEPCGKVLICGHCCTSPCGMACPPCRYSCFISCEHERCQYECGVPCKRTCEEPCPYICKHSQCTKKCSEVCNKTICNEPCPEILTCGHPCAGICGEMCPPYCQKCNPEKFVDGLLSGEEEMIATNRFIFLKDCGHCIESESMNIWMSLEIDQILPYRCPLCHTRINWIRRYSAKFDEKEKLINSVRVKIFGDQTEIQRILEDVEAKMVAHLEATRDEPFIPEYVEYIFKELRLPRWAVPQEKEIAMSMSIDKARFLNWITSEWIYASEIILELLGNVTNAQFNQFATLWREYLMDMAADRVWPMHPNEIRALERERDRLDDAFKLYSRVRYTPNGAMRLLINSMEGTRIFQLAEGVLCRIVPYTADVKREFTGHLNELDGVLHYTIQLTDRERLQITQAFGEGSGRWFKCVNGHVYVVTECGGATELGRCNECGALIGGENHALVQQNYLASEMDGAEQPLYPTALTRVRFLRF